jgi:hypothetical protein
MEGRFRSFPLCQNCFLTAGYLLCKIIYKQKQLFAGLQSSNLHSQKSVGSEYGFGSSNFGVCITELVDGMINVLHAEEYPRPDFNQMINATVRLLQEYNITFEVWCRIFVDGANPSFIKSLKLQIGEDADYDKVIARYKTEGLGDNNWSQNMRIVPVNFNAEHKAMLGHCKIILEQDPGKIAINPDRFDKLITSLRTAVDNDGTLDKEATSYNDVFDAFRLALKFYHFQERID